MFEDLKKKVQDRFKVLLDSGHLFVLQAEKNEMFSAYLNAIPEEYRQHYNCNCCRSFINNYGSLIATDGKESYTLWDFSLDNKELSAVPQAMRKFLKDRLIEVPFVSKISKLGTDYNFESTPEGSHRWNHFFLSLPLGRIERDGRSIEAIIGDRRTSKEVFARALREISLESVDMVLDLIKEGNLYRGAESKKSLESFRAHKAAFMLFSNPLQVDKYVWRHSLDLGAARIRNTAIGTLLVDLTSGMDEDAAVRKFEAMMAPANYRRPTAVVTTKMVNGAKEKIAALGLENSLKRRFATSRDIPLENLLFVNRSVRKDDIFGDLATNEVKAPKNAPLLSLSDFLGKLNSTSSLEFLLSRTDNFVSLVAPEDPDSPGIFAWSNPYSWTYANNLTDAVVEKVKKAGGNVTGELRISLEWFNYDDLDLHVWEPGGNEIYFQAKRSRVSSGFLDVDMNAGSGKTREPVENVAFTLPNMKEGNYKVGVHNWAKRENIDMGFNIQVACRGEVRNLSHPAPIADRSLETVCTFSYSKADGITSFKSALLESSTGRQSMTPYGISTGAFHKVNMALFSPNHWNEDEKGNKHLFFILEGACINDSLRGFFNEYLSPSLAEHRKVFELLGGKLTLPPSLDQLTGVGFSLTQDTTFTVRLNGKIFQVNTKENGNVRESNTGKASV